MRDVSAALAQHLEQELSHLAYLLKITRLDGQVLGFTTHDQRISIDTTDYLPSNSLALSSLESGADLATDNLELAGILESAAINDADIAAGRYDQARVDIFVCNWADLSMGTMQLKRGWLGEITRDGPRYKAELRGFIDAIQQPFGVFITPECRHNLGDSACGVALAAHMVAGTVTASSTLYSFTDSTRTEAAGIFSYGRLTWLSGENAGTTIEIKQHAAGGVFTLWLPMTAPIAVGDTYSLVAGCDKTLATCAGRFNNALNFGGFPHLPGVDRIYDYPDSK